MGIWSVTSLWVFVIHSAILIVRPINNRVHRDRFTKKLEERNIKKLNSTLDYSRINFGKAYIISMLSKETFSITSDSAIKTAKKCNFDPHIFRAVEPVGFDNNNMSFLEENLFFLIYI